MPRICLQEKILCGFDALAKANANEGDKSHVNDDNCKINGVQSSLPDCFMVT